MSQFSPLGTVQDRGTSRHATWALFTFPALGCALAVVSAFCVFVVASAAGTFALGDSASQGQPAYDYVQAHFPNSTIGFLTEYPPILAASCVLILAATALAVFRRWAPAVLLLVAAVALPWIPGLSFLGHLLSLPLH